MLLKKNTIGETNVVYDSMLPLWKRSRAVLSGELACKQHDSYLDTATYSNLLIPFSPRMSQEMYRWYVAEAELPGLSAQYQKILVGGLLRKSPSIVFPDDTPADAEGWIRNHFTNREQSLVAFLDDAVDEELKTGHCGVSVDFPVVDGYDRLSAQDRAKIRPFPVFWRSEEIINWQISPNRQGQEQLSRVILRYHNQDFTKNPYHGDYYTFVLNMFLNEAGVYQVEVWKQEDYNAIDVFQGQSETVFEGGSGWVKQGETKTPLVNGSPIRFIPFWFLSGSIQPRQPVLTPLIDREIALYNKLSRRNHLLLGAATYTPVLFTNASDDEFKKIVQAGLGSWIRLSPDDKVDVLKPPTEALKDMETAIEGSLLDLAKLGTRMLSPESTQAESGVALEIRNSAQTAQLAAMNNRISETIQAVISFMLEWYYGKPFEDLEFSLSADFNPTPLGAEWLKLVADWYERRLIPRSTFIQVAKHHDILPHDYNDKDGIDEIQSDELVPAPEDPLK